MTIQLVLFDVDDTLCDYAGARDVRLRIAFETAFAAAGRAAPMDLDAIIAASIEIHPHGTDHFGELLAPHGIESFEAILAAQRWYQINRFHGLRLFPDALEILLLARAAEAKRTVGLITNGPAETQRAKIDELGLTPYVDFALISGEFGVAKPDPAIFREALRLAGVKAHEAIFIGDSPEFDIAGARASGIRSVWINRTGRPWSDSTREPDDEIINLASLRTVFDNGV